MGICRKATGEKETKKPVYTGLGYFINQKGRDKIDKNGGEHQDLLNILRPDNWKNNDINN